MFDQHDHNNDNNRTHSGAFAHPCAGNGLYGTLLITGALVFVVMLTGRLCARYGAKRYRRIHPQCTSQKAKDKCVLR